MIHSIVRVLQIIAVLGTISSSIYYLLCLWSAAVFLGERRATGESPRSTPEQTAQALPPVSILKPLKGIDPQIYESFRSHCLQDYPEYEIIFGVNDPADPAVAFVKQLQGEFSQRDIRLVVCSRLLGANVKVSNLVQMLAVARHGRLVVNDSDIRVEPDYLRRVIAPLAVETVGMVTCLYRGTAASTLGSRLESLGISADFCPSVLAARQLEGIRFGLGSTLAFRRADLERIGGFESLLDYLADDYELGKKIWELGLEIQLSDVVVETYLPGYRVRDFFAHQMRWALGVRDSRLGGYLGLMVTFGLMWSCLTLLAARGAPWAWVVLATTLLLRLTMALTVGGAVLRDRGLLKHLWLLPIRDLVAVVVWAASFAGHTVTWRGDRFELKNGKLIRIAL
jgi:ceramide glucosyltransferase